MGLIARDRHDFVAAEDAFERAVVVYGGHYGTDHPRTFGPVSNLAEVLVRKGENERAEPLLVENIRRYRSLQDGPSTKLSQDIDMLSQVRLNQGRNDEAIVLAMEADDGYSRLLGADHNYRAFPLIHLGNARLGAGDGTGALLAFEEALRLRRLAFGNEHPDVANALHNLGAAYAQLGNPQAAEKTLREALTISEQVLPAGHVAIPRMRMGLVETLIKLNQMDEAGIQLARIADELEAAPDDNAQDQERFADLKDAVGRSTYD